MEMIRYYKKVLSKYATFKGRASRKEYWYFTLMNFLIILISSIILAITCSYDTFEENIFIIIYSLAIFMPSLAVTVRRLHDTNRSGWWIVLSFIPFLGIVLFVFSCLKGTEGINKYGISEDVNINEV